MVFLLAAIVMAVGQAGGVKWERVVTIDPTAIRTEREFMAALTEQGAPQGGYANWFTGRWPNISFIGGMVMGNVSDHLQFFYQKPFTWSSRVLDYVMEGGGKTYGVRATIHPYGDRGTFPAGRSYLLWYRCDVLLKDYHPSYILVNGRRMWDSRKHPLLDGKILIPFSLDEPGNPVIDFVVDLDYTPEVKGLAFRMFNTAYIGRPGVKVALRGASEAKEPSPADSEERFAFGVFPSSYDFWHSPATPIADLKRDWLPNFRPDYPTDELWLSPFIGEEAAQGPYHDFMVTYGGCNILGTNPPPAILSATDGYARGAMAKPLDVESARKVLAISPGFQAHWFGGEEGVLSEQYPTATPEQRASLKRQADEVASAKRATGDAARVKMVWEPFPPALTAAHEYERGRDVLVLKNEEDPQYNIMMSMARGAGRTFGKPFGYYWEQTHYPYPSLDFKLQACLLYYLSGGSWIGAEAEQAPSFGEGQVAEWVLPYVKALRFAMVHPARGTPIVPIGIAWGYGDRWWAPYNPLGQMDTFMRSISYDHATHKITCEPTFVKRLPWMPADRSAWSFQNAGHLGYFIDRVDELRGYNLLDVFFPKNGDAFTAHIARLLTGTPYGPVDFTYLNRVPVDTLKTYGLLAILGHADLNTESAAKLVAAAESGTTVVIGGQHLRKLDGDLLGPRMRPGDPQTLQQVPPGLAIPQPSVRGRLFSADAPGWTKVVAADMFQHPLILRRAVGKGAIYAYLGEWMGDGGKPLRDLLQELAEKAAPLRFGPKNDQMEYVAYRKGAGAWVALLNHGAITVGCDRLKVARAIPPEPLCSEVRGPWRGQIEFRLDRLGMDSSRPYALYEVSGIDGPAFERVISGRGTFKVKPIPSNQKDGVLRTQVTIGKRAEYVIAPPGEGRAVFFGKP